MPRCCTARAKGNYRRGSDVDVCLQGPALTFVMLPNLESALDDLLLPDKIDLSLQAHIDNDALRGHIARHGVPLYRRAG